MAVLTAPIYVSNPVPQNIRYGLFTVANGPLDLPPHGRDGGIDYETAVSLCNGTIPASGFAVNCIQNLSDKTLAGGTLTRNADPFVVISSLQCGSVGMTNERLRQFLVERLKANEQAVVERIFSLQTFGQSPGLQSPNVTQLPGVANVVAAVSALEDAFYSVYGLPGVIHAPFSAQAWFAQSHQAHKDGLIWRTMLGTAVSFGNYAGVSVTGAGAPAGSEFIYITGPVTIWRTNDSDLFIPTMEQALNRTTNQVHGLIEREYVVAFDCPGYGVETPLAVP